MYVMYACKLCAPQIRCCFSANSALQLFINRLELSRGFPPSSTQDAGFTLRPPLFYSLRRPWWDLVQFCVRARHPAVLTFLLSAIKSFVLIQYSQRLMQRLSDPNSTTSICRGLFDVQLNGVAAVWGKIIQGLFSDFQVSGYPAIR